MTDSLKKLVVAQIVLLAVTCAATLVLGAAWWTTSGGPSASESRRRESAAQVDQLTATVRELSKTVAQLQAANDLLMQTAMRNSSRTNLEPRLRAIQEGVDEQNMMFRRYLAQYRR